MAENVENAPLAAVNPNVSDEGKGPFDHPVYKKLAVLNGEINKMTKQQMVEKLKQLHLDTRGLKDVLKKRLKNYYRRTNLQKVKVKTGPDASLYKYLLVIDFEATCDRETRNYPHEIIEFPVVLVDADDRTVVDEFHSFVRPSVNPHLSQFCIELTGITQDQVSAAPLFPEVLDAMEKWMGGHQLGSEHKFAVVTDGPWDMSRFMFMQCQTSDVVVPKWARKWINIRKAFCNKYRTKKASVLTMLESFGLAFQGKQHSGIADARNIARIAIQMLEDGCTFNVNEKLTISQSQSAEVVSVSRNQASSDEDGIEEASAISGSNQKYFAGIHDGVGDGLSKDDDKTFCQTPETAEAKIINGPSGKDLSDVEVDDCADLLRYVALRSSNYIDSE